MRKGKGLLKKLLAVTAIAGGAAILITKFKKSNCTEGMEDGTDEEEAFDGEIDPSSRNYVPLSHEEKEDAIDEPVSEETLPEEAVLNETVSEDTPVKKSAPSAAEIAAKLEQAVAETEARYEEAVKEAGTSKDN